MFSVLYWSGGVVAHSTQLQRCSAGHENDQVPLSGRIQS